MLLRKVKLINVFYHRELRCKKRR